MCASLLINRDTLLIYNFSSSVLSLGRNKLTGISEFLTFRKEFQRFNGA